MDLPSLLSDRVLPVVGIGAASYRQPEGGVVWLWKKVWKRNIVGMDKEIPVRLHNTHIIMADLVQVLIISPENQIWILTII